MKKQQKQKGIGIIEIIICLSIITIAFWGFLELNKYNLKIQEQSQGKTEALNLAEESIEAVRSIRNKNWNDLAILTSDTNYYPVLSGNSWTLNAINPGLINNKYNRWVVLEKVYRDSNSNIVSSGGTEDLKTKKITSFVEWTSHGQTNQVNLVIYLTKWRN